MDEDARYGSCWNYNIGMTILEQLHPVVTLAGDSSTEVVVNLSIG